MRRSESAKTAWLSSTTSTCKAVLANAMMPSADDQLWTTPGWQLTTRALHRRGEDTARGPLPSADCRPATPPESSHSSADENAAQQRVHTQPGKPKPEDSARTESPRQRQAARPTLHHPAPLPPGYRPATAGASPATPGRANAESAQQQVIPSVTQQQSLCHMFACPAQHADWHAEHSDNCLWLQEVSGAASTRPAPGGVPTRMRSPSSCRSQSHRRWASASPAGCSVPKRARRKCSWGRASPAAC